MQRPNADGPREIIYIRWNIDADGARRRSQVHTAPLCTAPLEKLTIHPSCVRQNGPPKYWRTESMATRCRIASFRRIARGMKNGDEGGEANRTPGYTACRYMCVYWTGYWWLVFGGHDIPGAKKIWNNWDMAVLKVLVRHLTYYLYFSFRLEVSIFLPLNL